MFVDLFQLVNAFNAINQLLEYEYIPDNEKLFNDYKNREEKLSDFMNDFLINKTNILWDNKGELKIPPSIFIQKFLEILKEYLNYTNLNYFSIPIIGKISSGKSTFLNSLLGIDCLESATKITTKFICIIRHNENNKTPRLYPVIKKERKSEINPKAYNFFKDEKNELKGDLKEHIKKINEKIKNCPNLKKLKMEEFLYILEANLDIFKGTNFKYSKMFEFLDIPGLDEITEFYLQNVIPYITPNTHFSIFLFDAGGCEDEGSKVLFNKFLRLMNSKAKKNSFFIYNKLDIFRKRNLGDLNEENQILYFRNEILFREYKLKLKNNHLIGLDSIQLKHDKKKDQSFKDYVLSYIQSLSDNDNNKFNILLKNKMKEDFKIKKMSVKEDSINGNEDAEDEKHLNEVNKCLEEKYYDTIDIKFYRKMKKLFNLNNKFIPKNENKVEKFSELYQKFNKSFKDTVEDFVLNKNLILLIQTFNTLLIRLYEQSKTKEEKEHIRDIIYHMSKHFRKILYPNMEIKKEEGIDDDIVRYRFINFEFEIKNIFEWNKEIIASLHSDLNRLKDFNSELINKMTLNVQKVLNYFNNKKIRTIFIGQEYSGKSSILNIIIGGDILPIHEINKNSNINLVLQSNNNYNDENIKLYTAKIKLIDNYFIFEKCNNEAIASGKVDVKKKLIELKTKDTNFEKSFYILNIPINFFKIIHIGDETLNKFEIIYLSGKYIKDLQFGKNKDLEILIKYTDNFIYIQNESNISEQSFLILKKIIFFISAINPSFNLEKFLFLINKCTKEDLTKTIINPLQIFLPKVSWFSKNDYENFLKLKNLVKEDIIFFTKIINKIKEKKKYDLLAEILAKIKSFQKFHMISKMDYLRRMFINTFLDIFFRKPDEIINNLKSILMANNYTEQDLEKNKKKIIQIAEEFFFLQNSIYNHVTNYESNADIFMSELYNLIFNTKFYLDYNLKITIENTKDYLNSTLSLIDKKISENDIENSKYFFSDNNEGKKILERFEDYFKEYKENILDILEEYKNKYILNIKDLYKNKKEEGKNIDKFMENEEDIFFDSMMDKLSKYDEVYEIFLGKNNLNNIALSSKIFVKDYNRGKINKESIKSKFQFGWFFFYNIRNKIKCKFLLPQSICYFYNEQNFKESQCEEYYKFRYQGFKYFINNILQDLYFEMKNNLEHILQLKSENFSKIKENVNDFIKVYIDLYDLFDPEEDEDEDNNENNQK